MPDSYQDLNRVRKLSKLFCKKQNQVGQTKTGYIAKKPAESQSERYVILEEELFGHRIWQQKEAWLQLYKSADCDIDYGVQNLLKEMSHYGVAPEVMD